MEALGPVIPRSRASCEEPISSSLEGRVVVQLPTDSDSQKKWEELGIQWLENLDGLFLAKALLPSDWRVKTDSKKIEIIDPCNRVHAAFSIKTTLHASGFEPVYYPGYRNNLSCSYDQLVHAIAPWGKVETILTKEEACHHLFIVRFNSPIPIGNSCRSQHTVNSEGRISLTPFVPRGLYNQEGRHFIGSQELIAFDIPSLYIRNFSAVLMCKTLECIPDDKLSAILKLDIEWQRAKELINEKFTDSDKAKKLLEWITKSGSSLQKEGWHTCYSHPNATVFHESPPQLVALSAREITENYQMADPAWKILLS